MNTYIFINFLTIVLGIFFFINQKVFKKNLGLPCAASGIAVILSWLINQESMPYDVKFILYGFLIYISICLVFTLIAKNKDYTGLFYALLSFYPSYVALVEDSLFLKLIAFDLLIIISVAGSFLSKKYEEKRNVLISEVLFSIFSWFSCWCFYLATENLSLTNFVVINQPLYLFSIGIILLRLFRFFSLFPFDGIAHFNIETKNIFSTLNYFFIYLIIMSYATIKILQILLIQLSPSLQSGLEVFSSTLLVLGTFHSVLKIFGTTRLIDKIKSFISLLWTPFLLAIWIDDAGGHSGALVFSMLLTFLTGMSFLALSFQKSESFNLRKDIEQEPFFSICFLVVTMTVLGMPSLGPMFYRAIFFKHLISFSEISLLIYLIMCSTFCGGFIFLSYFKQGKRSGKRFEESTFDRFLYGFITLFFLGVGFFSLDEISTFLGIK